jgi:hypothetical protein
VEDESSQMVGNRIEPEQLMGSHKVEHAPRAVEKLPCGREPLPEERGWPPVRNRVENSPVILDKGIADHSPEDHANPKCEKDGKTYRHQGRTSGLSVQDSSASIVDEVGRSGRDPKRPEAADPKYRSGPLHVDHRLAIIHAGTRKSNITPGSHCPRSARKKILEPRMGAPDRPSMSCGLMLAQQHHTSRLGRLTALEAAEVDAGAH